MAEDGQCRREGLTPLDVFNLLLIDCEKHGPVGFVARGADELERAELSFSEHVKEQTNG